MPSRRHSRQTGPLYRAKSNLPNLDLQCQVQFTAMAGLRPAYFITASLRTDSRPADLRTNQTRRFFGGRQPLCGIGVTSLIDSHFNAGGRQRADGRLAARARAR